MLTHRSAQELSVPGRAQRALDLLRRAQDRAAGMPTDTHAAKARRSGRFAELYEREARWWDRLAAWTYVESDLPTVYGRAVLAAQREAVERAEQYRGWEANSWRRSLLVASDSGVAA